MKRALHLVFDHWLTVPIGALVALAWSNTAPESYFTLAHRLSFLVNNIGMSFFMALVAQEVVEALLPGGALHTWRRWTTPIAAAIGGIIGSVGIYELYVYSGDESVLAAGWPIVCATDIALAYSLTKSLFGRGAAMPFILLVAIASDAVGSLAVGLAHQSATVYPYAALLIVLGVSISAVLARRRVSSFWPHILIAGTISWIGFTLSGLHPALSLVPIVPFLPHAPRSLNGLTGEAHGPHRSARHFEHVFRIPAHIVLFFFALVNAGTLLPGFGTGTWAVLLGALVGKPAGVLLGTAVAVAAGFHLPHRVGWKELVTIALLTSAGFTFALFFATGVYPIGSVLSEVKLGALATGAAVLSTVGAAALLRVGRFAADRHLSPSGGRSSNHLDVSARPARNAD